MCIRDSVKTLHYDDTAPAKPVLADQPVKTHPETPGHAH